MNTVNSFIHPNATIGDGALIHPFTFIDEDVVIGDHCEIGPNATIMNGARIGSKCRIFPGAVISAPPQDLKYKGEPSTVTLEDHVTIRECVTVNRGTILDKNNTRVGKNSLLMAYTHVAHDCDIGEHVILANGVQMAGHVKIGDYAFIGGTVAIHQHVKIGDHSMISGGSLVRKDVPPYITAAREPLSYSGINSIGLRRRGFSKDQIFNIQEVYRFIYLSGLNNTAAIEKIRLELNPTAERDEIIYFIENASRGLIRGLGDQKE